ncbi:hypothetical protein KP509_08G011100 [Ceratopteris richardii]|nr:hypothetical protein KP509_08G011100 [Ceratopteris richardii]
MIVNRICELIAFMFTGGMLPSLFAIVQVPLSLFSTTIYANRHQHLQNHLLLAVYCTLLVYECLVALLLVKMGCYLKRLESIDPQESRSLPGQQSPQPYIALHMFALFAQPLSAGCPYIGDFESELNSEVDGYVTVQQPDGMKVVLGKVLQSNLESCQELDIEATKGEENGNKADHVKITIPQLPLPSSHVSDSIGEVAANSDILAAQSSALHSQMATQNEADVIPSLRSFQAV